MQLLDFTIRIAMSILFGFIIGFEREVTGHPAGIRTNVLVSLGSCMFVMFSLIMDAPDRTRVAAQIVTGVGFLGSGIIFKEGMNVRGINTAATIWCTAAIGMLTSTGKIQYALVATILLVSANIIFRPIAKKLSRLDRFDETEKYYKVSVICAEDATMTVRRLMMEQTSLSGFKLTGLDSCDVIGDRAEIVAKISCDEHRKDDMIEMLLTTIGSEQHVISAGWEWI